MDGESDAVTFSYYLNLENNEQTCYANIERDIAEVRLPKSKMTVSDDEPNRVHALGKAVRSLNVVCSFVECNFGTSEMLCRVGLLQNMTLGAASYRTRQARIED